MGALPGHSSVRTLKTLVLTRPSESNSDSDAHADNYLIYRNTIGLTTASSAVSCRKWRSLPYPEPLSRTWKRSGATATRVAMPRSGQSV